MKQLILAAILIFGFGFSAFAQNQNSLCAKIEVTGGGVVRTGEPMTFTANVTGLTKNSTLEYEWTVSNGTISSGQGTPSITVDTTGLSDTNITAEVKDFPKIVQTPHCQTALSFAAVILDCSMNSENFRIMMQPREFRTFMLN